MFRTAIILTILGLIGGTVWVHAEPIKSELKSYKCLVPDFLISSGGSSSALSPDGTVLVYKTDRSNTYSEDRVWILNNASYQYDHSKGVVPIQPWELVINEKSTSPPNGDGGLDDEYCNVDVSPDGKKVVFTCYGRLYMAEIADLKAQQNKVTKLCDKIVGEDNTDSPIIAPRWSPDGKQVAFMLYEWENQFLCRICVVDVATGEMKVVASNASMYLNIWKQPWSPDSKHIVYSSISGTNNINPDPSKIIFGMSVVSTSDGSIVKIFDNNISICPSWSPTGNRVAYTGIYTDNTSRVSSMSINFCDIQSKKITVVDKPVYPFSVLNQMKSIVLKILKKDYHYVFTETQLTSLSKITMTSDDGSRLLWLAQCRLTGDREGGEFSLKIKAAMEHLSVDMRNIEEVTRIADKAFQKLPEEKRKIIDTASGTRESEMMEPFKKLGSKYDSPIWSPDANRIAYIRTGLDETSKLIVMDLTTRKVKTVFESKSIGPVSWTKDGKFLLLQARRGLAHTTKPSANPNDIIVEQWPQSTNTSSYPEIWLIEPK